MFFQRRPGTEFPAAVVVADNIETAAAGSVKGKLFQRDLEFHLPGAFAFDSACDDHRTPGAVCFFRSPGLKLMQKIGHSSFGIDDDVTDIPFYIGKKEFRSIVFPDHQVITHFTAACLVLLGTDNFSVKKGTVMEQI